MAKKASTRNKQLKAGSKVLVTGAAGAVGRFVVRQLLDAGYKVRATDLLSREDAGIDALVDPKVPLEWSALNLVVWSDFDELVAGCDAVVHTAAYTSLTESYYELKDINVAVVKSLYDAAMRNSVKHFVHFSCASVYLAERGVRSEGDPIWATNDYEKTKIASEEIIREMAEDNASTPWTILRPGLIYGPYCTALGAGLFTFPPILRGFTKYLPGISGGPRSNWCHVEDAASAVVAALGNPKAFERVFNVADDTPMSFGEVMTTITESYGLEVGPSVPFPNQTLWTVLSPLIDHDVVFDGLRTLLRQLWRRVQTRYEIISPLRPRIDRNALFYVSDDTMLLTEALKELGWVPAHPELRKGLCETVRWYQDNRWAPKFDMHEQVKLRDGRQEHGIAYTEVFSGEFLKNGDAEPESIQMTVDVEWRDVKKPWRQLAGHINGYVWVDGIVSNAPARGTIVLDNLAKLNMHYEFGFEDNKGRAYRFDGQRGLRKGCPFGAMSRLEGSIINQFGEVVGSAVIRFDFREQFRPLLESIRFIH